VDFKSIREDPKLRQELKRKEEEALKRGDLVTLYDLLDTYLALDIEDESVDRLYEKILELAFDRLSEKLTEGEIFDLSRPEELATARAIYEHALERWDRGEFVGAKELFLVLSYMIDDPSIRKSLLLSLALTAQRESLDHFLQEFVDRSRLDEESLFFNALLPSADNYLAEKSDLIERELERVRKWQV